MFQSPVSVLDKTIQDGKKIPRWKPRSARFQFMGFSGNHATSAPLVLNPATGAITPQFHVVFDDWFATVASSIADLPDFNSPEWQRMFGDSVFQYVDEEDLPPDDTSPFNDRYERVTDKLLKPPLPHSLSKLFRLLRRHCRHLLQLLCHLLRLRFATLKFLGLPHRPWHRL